MRAASVLLTTLLGAALLAGCASPVGYGCSPERAAAGLCGSAHHVDDDDWLHGRADGRGHREKPDGDRADRRLPRPPALALDNREGNSTGDAYRYRSRDLDRDEVRRRSGYLDRVQGRGGHGDGSRRPDEGS